MTIKPSIITKKELRTYFRDLGFFVYVPSKDIMNVLVSVASERGFIHNPGALDFDDRELVLTGETGEEMFNQYEAWKNNKKLWIDQGERIVFDFSDSKRFNFDLEEELLTLGFTSATVEHEDSNFVEVLATYTYIDEEEEVQVGGELQVDDQGDKLVTLNYINEWIQKSKEFKPAK